MKTLLMVAGDASGDQHAAEFVRTFRELHPDTRFVGMGGVEMQRCGVDLAVNQSELAIGGFLELVGSAHRIVRAWRQMVSALRAENPDLVVLVDSGGFNLPFARRVRRISKAPLLYYVAPQVWAWRRGRVRKLASRIDRMALILPFEESFYADQDISVEYVGHPLADRFLGLSTRMDRDEAQRALGLEPVGFLVTLMPGSRRNEVAQNLPLQLEAVRRLHRDHPDLEFVLGVAPSVTAASVEAICSRAGLPADLRLSVVTGQAQIAIRAADVVLAKPGIVTLEAAVLDRPMVVMGRVHPVTAAILRRWVKAPYFAMPNLIAECEVVPELLQDDARPDAIARRVQELLEGPTRERQLKGLEEVRRRLGGGGASRRASRIAEEMLGLASS